MCTMPYFKPSDNGYKKEIYSKYLIDFAWKNSKEWVKDCLKRARLDINGFEKLMDLGGVCFILFVPIYYFIRRNKYKTNSKEFDPKKNLEGNLS